MATLTQEQAASLLHDWRFWARPDQLPPEGDWTFWLMLAGRGFGKTRSGAEYIKQYVRDHPRCRVALVAQTQEEGRDTMVEGVSGLLSVLQPSDLMGGALDQAWNRSLLELYFANGSKAKVFSAEKGSSLRGPQHHVAWCDEVAKWKDASKGMDEDTTWSNLALGLRLGDHPRCVITTTPRPVKIIKHLLVERELVVTRGTTYDNLPNLAPSFAKSILQRYEGSRLGRQELRAELLEDVEGALWTRAMIDDHRIDEAPADLTRIVIAVDPAVTSTESSDQTGIVVAARKGFHAYILQDATGPPEERLTPLEWAERAVTQFDLHRADKIIGEVNNGGDLVETNIRTVRSTVAYEKVTASRGKAVRAQPVAALYEQGRVHHVGAMPDLEDQLCTWSPDLDKSPDRLDALVWAVYGLGLLEVERGAARVTII